MRAYLIVEIKGKEGIPLVAATATIGAEQNWVLPAGVHEFWVGEKDPLKLERYSVDEKCTTEVFVRDGEIEISVQEYLSCDDPIIHKLGFGQSVKLPDNFIVTCSRPSTGGDTIMKDHATEIFGLFSEKAADETNAWTRSAWGRRSCTENRKEHQMRVITKDHATEICELFNDKVIEEIRGSQYLMQVNSAPCMDAPIARVVQGTESTVRLNEYF